MSNSKLIEISSDLSYYANNTNKKLLVYTLILGICYIL